MDDLSKEEVQAIQLYLKEGWETESRCEKRELIDGTTFRVRHDGGGFRAEVSPGWSSELDHCENRTFGSAKEAKIDAWKQYRGILLLKILREPPPDKAKQTQSI